jgi:sugar phosphate isomerase/epimerase
MITRRTLLASSAAAPLAFGAKAPFVLGVASYSLRKLSRADAIAAIVKLGVRHVSVKEFHLPFTSTPAEIDAARKEFAAAKIKILSGGNIALTGDDATLRKMFDYAKAAGMPMIVCAPSHATVGKVEALVKEFNIRAAIHNHGPEDKHFPTPQSVMDAVKNMDPRMGLCIDIGHTVRTGADVIESIRTAGKAGRLFDLHVKDLRDLRDKDSQCALGEGKMPVKEIFSALKKLDFKGGAMLEYEINADNPVPGMEKSFVHMREVLAQIA